MTVRIIFLKNDLVLNAQLTGLVEKDKMGQIIVDKKNQTSVGGIFAAGDVTDITKKQISSAVVDGYKTALEIFSWLTHH